MKGDQPWEYVTRCASIHDLKLDWNDQKGDNFYAQKNKKTHIQTYQHPNKQLPKKQTMKKAKKSFTEKGTHFQRTDDDSQFDIKKEDFFVGNKKEGCFQTNSRCFFSSFLRKLKWTLDSTLTTKKVRQRVNTCLVFLASNIRVSSVVWFGISFWYISGNVIEFCKFHKIYWKFQKHSLFVLSRWHKIKIYVSLTMKFCSQSWQFPMKIILMSFC